MNERKFDMERINETSHKVSLEVAKVYRSRFTAYVDVGFTEDQAFQMILAEISRPQSPISDRTGPRR